jgi:hypothetical protein
MSLPNGTRARWLAAALAHESDDCFLWPAPLKRRQYPCITQNGKQLRINRIVCAHFHGAPSSERLEAAHRCGNKACINYRHLYWATPKQNSDDRLIHGTANRGTRNGRAKLTIQQVLQIRKTVGSPKDIAPLYGVSHQSISNIRNGYSWRWL